MRELTGTAIAKWLDLLGQTVDGDLIHLELQSSNDTAMPFRMIEYCLGVQRLFGQFPRQVLLYVGEAPMRMESKLRGPDLSFEYRLIDIRTLNGELLLESRDVGNNVIAILARLRDHKEAVHRIVGRIAGLAAAEGETALAQLTILAGLRHLARTVEQETRNMPIDLDIRDHETLGPIIKEFSGLGFSRRAKAASWGDEHSSPKGKTRTGGSKEGDWMYTGMVPGAKMEIPAKTSGGRDGVT